LPNAGWRHPGGGNSWRGAVVEVCKNGLFTQVPIKEFLEKSERDKAYLSQFKPVK
jgi:hypothetical protein